MKRTTAFISIVSVLAVIGVTSAAGADRAPAPAAEAVAKTMPTITWNNATLVDVLVRYRATTGAKITVDWEALKAASVTPQSRVTLAANDLTFAQVLDLTLARVQGARTALSWMISNHNVHVTTQAAVLAANRSPARPARAQGRPGRPDTPRPQVERQADVVMDFDEVPLEDVVAYFRSIRPTMNFFVAWNALEALGVTRDTPVTLRITQPVSLAGALDLFVGTLSTSPDPRLQVFWEFRNNILSITTGEVLDRALEVRTFDVSDLLFVAPDYWAPQIEATDTTRGSSTRGGAASASGGGFGLDTGFGRTGAGAGADPGRTVTDQGRVEQEAVLAEIIRNAIGEQYWQPLGRGSIRFHRGHMIISQSRLGFRLLSESLSRSRDL